LGDNPNDVQMIEGFAYKNLLKVWFLNKEEENYLERFREVYDIVILHDGPLDFVNEIVQKIVAEK
jgi:hypothetical protein